MAGTKLKPLEAVWLCSASVGAGLPEALTANVRSTPAVVATGPGFALKTGATSAVRVATFATEELALVPPALVARTRK